MKIYRISGNKYKTISRIRIVRRLLLKEQQEHTIINPNGKKDRKIYVIRWMNGEDIGLMGMFRHAVFHIGYAIENGYIPIVDWCNFYNPYLESKIAGKENAWEYYFQQPCGYSLQDIDDFYEIKLGSAESIEKGKPYHSEENYGIVSKYIKFSPEVDARVQSIMKDIYSKKGEGARILGVKLRGTDYITTKTKKHAIQPTVEYAIEVIKQCMSEWGGYDICFLATEDNTIIKKMKKEFGDWIYIQENIDRLEADEKWYESSTLSSNPRKSGEDYCVEIAMLAKCDALIASGSQGTTGAVLLNNKMYEHTHIIDLGSNL